jgi:hypothetical protein
LKISESLLAKSYLSDNNLYEENNRLAISGTHSATDITTDLFIPFDITQTKRYQDAYDFIKEREGTPFEVLEVTGHSLGSSIAQRLYQEFPNKHYKLFATPFSAEIVSDRVHYYRHSYDPISFLNKNPNLTETPYLSNPHTFKGYV